MPHRFRSQRLPLLGAPGQVIGYNPHRGSRPRAGPETLCPFCHRVNDADVTCVAQHSDYLVFPNKYPLVEDQLVFIPREHRVYPTPADFRILRDLVNTGLAVYLNGPGAGQSVSHLHQNGVPQDAVPLPEARPAEWCICRGVGTASIRRMLGLGYYGITVDGAADDMTLTLAALEECLRCASSPFNVFAWSAHGAFNVVVVPRSTEDSPTAEQRIAGLELMSAVIHPGDGVRDKFDVVARDKALEEVTFSPEAALTFERHLRSAFGPPDMGSAVFVYQ